VVHDSRARAGVRRATFLRIFETKAGLLHEFNHRIAADAAARLDAGQSANLATSLEIIPSTTTDAWSHAGPRHVALAQAFTQSAPRRDPHAAHPELLPLVQDRIEVAMGRATCQCGPVGAGGLARAAPNDRPDGVRYVLEDSRIDFDALCQLLLRQWLEGMKSTRRDGGVVSRWG